MFLIAEKCRNGSCRASQICSDLTNYEKSSTISQCAIPRLKLLTVIVDTKTVACALPSDLVSKIDRRLARTFTARAEWLRRAILKAAEAEGLIKIEIDHAGEIRSLDLSGAAA